MKRMKRERRAPEIAFWLFYSLKRRAKGNPNLYSRLMGELTHLWLFYGPGTIPRSVACSLGFWLSPFH